MTVTGKSMACGMVAAGILAGVFGGRYAVGTGPVGVPQAAAATFAADAPPCAGCSEYDLGARFATRSELQHADDCPEVGYDWRRGCASVIEARFATVR